MCEYASKVPIPARHYGNVKPGDERGNFADFVVLFTHLCRRSRYFCHSDRFVNDTRADRPTPRAFLARGAPSLNSSHYCPVVL